MNESILTSIKKLLGIQPDYHHFDDDLIICINSVLSILTQLGVGPKSGFSVTDESAVWNNYIKNDIRIQLIKSFVHLRVRLLFDPPQNASLADAIDRMAKELEWRIQVMADEVGKTEPSPDEDPSNIATDEEVLDMLDDVLG